MLETKEKGVTDELMTKEVGCIRVYLVKMHL